MGLAMSDSRPHVVVVDANRVDDNRFAGYLPNYRVSQIGHSENFKDICLTPPFPLCVVLDCSTEAGLFSFIDQLLDANIPVIALSAAPTDAQASALFNHGVDDYFPKETLTEAMLAHAVDRAIKKRDNQQELFHHQQLFAELPLGIIVLRREDTESPPFVCEYANRAFLQLVAPLPESGPKRLTIPPALVRGELTELCTLAIETENVQRFPVLRVDKHVFDVYAIPLTSRHVGIALYDQTERIDALGQQARLERQVRAVQRMEAVGRLAGGVAHDFNNLLTAIFSFGRFAFDSLDKNHPARADIQEVLKAADRAETLTRQLLAFSRRQTIDPKVINVNDLFDDIAPMLRRLLGEDVELHTAPGADLWNIKVDRGAVEQVIVNLAVNARDAMSEGGQLTIETSNVVIDDSYGERHDAEVPPGSYVLISVTDDGVGISKSDLPHIFEPFFTTKPEGEGTGLGLATCYGIVKQANGFIWVYSELGLGTTFKVYLPRSSEANTAEVVVAPLAAARGQETILIAEDNDQVRSLVAKTLTGLGYTVLLAANGGEALLLAEARGGRIDLLLTDVVMPRIGGRELAERLPSVCRSLKILYMSGYAANAIVHHGVLHPGTALLQKPFTPHQLGVKVREVLDADAYYLETTAEQPRVLLIDDDPKLLRATARMLRGICDVTPVESARAALELIRKETFDTILCDVLMPDLSGPELHAIVQRERPGAADRFVFISGGGTVDRSLLQGTLLRKPLSRQEIEDAVKQTRPSGN